MSKPLNSTEIQPESAARSYEQDARRHRAILNEIIELGADMVRFVHQQAKTLAEAASPEVGETAPATAELAGAFDQVTRCIRRSVLLVAKLAEPVTIAAPARARIAARQRIIRGVEDAIQFEFDGVKAERLHAELLDRLDSPDLPDGIEGRPVGEIIAEICHDLGLDVRPGSHPWARRTPADLVVLRARAAASPRSGKCAAYTGAPVAGDGTTLVERDTRCRDP